MSWSLGMTSYPRKFSSSCKINCRKSGGVFSFLNKLSTTSWSLPLCEDSRLVGASPIREEISPLIGGDPASAGEGVVKKFNKRWKLFFLVIITVIYSFHKHISIIYFVCQCTLNQSLEFWRIWYTFNHSTQVVIFVDLTPINTFF